jgi:hypothetical protein
MQFKYAQRRFLISLRPELEEGETGPLATIETTLLNDDGSETEYGVCTVIEFNGLSRAMVARLAESVLEQEKHPRKWDGDEVAIELPDKKLRRASPK